MAANGIVEGSEAAGEAAEELVKAIERIDEGVKRIASSGLTAEAIILLVSKASGVRLNETRRVLGGLQDIKKRFLRQPPKAARS